MKNTVKVKYGCLLFDDTILNLEDVCIIRPCQNQCLGGIEVYLTNGETLNLRQIPFSLLENESFLGFIDISNTFINVKKVSAITPLDKNYGYEGSLVIFKSRKSITLPNIDSKIIIKKIMWYNEL